MNPLQAIILGIVEGLTEFLPISSTAHLLVANRLLGLEIDSFVKSFDIFIQLGAILAVVVLYVRRFIVERRTLIAVAAAFIPTAIIGLLLYPVVKSLLLDSLFLVAWALIIGGLCLILFERWHKKRSEGTQTVSNKNAAAIGLFQALALIPGVSRAGATIIGGLALGISRKTIVEFSFLLAVPTMAAAVGLDLLKSDFTFSSNEWLLLAIGFVAAFLTALAAIRFFLSFIERRDFTLFGWYRIALGAAIIIFLL